MKKHIINIVFYLFILPTPTVFAEQSHPLFNVTSTGLTLTLKTTYPNHVYTEAGIKLITPEYSLANPDQDCIQIANGYCSFSVSNSAEKTISLHGKSGQVTANVCLNATAPVSCQYYTSAISYAYVANYSAPSVSSCTLNNGTPISCTAANPTSGFTQPTQIVLNNARTRAYISNANSISVCIITDGLLASCALYDPTNSIQGGTGIALNNTESRAYISNNTNNTISICSIDKGSIDSCTNYANDTFHKPSGIALKNMENRIYVLNYENNTVSSCEINNGILGSCNPTSTIFNGPQGITLNSPGTRAYIANGNSSTVSVCSIDNGSLDSCTPYSDPTFDGCDGIALNADETVAYVANFNNSTLSVCSIDQGVFNSCTAYNPDSSFNGPSGNFISY